MRDVTTPAVPDVGSIGSDPDVFEVFYREHIGTVQRYVARRVANPHLAADMTADVFLAAIDSASTYRPDRGAPVSWLLGIARHVLATEFRRQSRDREVLRRVSGRRLLDADSLARIEERIAAEREARNLYDALASLSRRDRALMELVAVDGLPVAAAADLLGMKPGTARVRLHRSRTRIQSQLTPRTQEVIA